ncbi:MAG: hypothetical protein JNM56_06875 [Planctomycetia bacterium]|nr:hypothetical protein [Planctomycetia bacterium]
MKTISSAGSAGLGQTGAPFVETVPPRSVGFYCLKNGLSAHLISTLAEKRLHRRQVVLSNCWLPPEQESVVFGEVRQSAFDADFRVA